MELLADTIVDPTTGWLHLAAPLGVAGILAWFLYHTTTVLFPRVLDRVDTICTNHDRTSVEIVNKFSEEMKIERQSHREDLQLLVNTFRCDRKVS